MEKFLDFDSYDKTNKDSIIRYANLLIGHTFEDIAMNTPNKDEEMNSFFTSSRKGGLGNFLEKYYFGYEINSDRNADFKKAGLELKATPYERKQNGGLRAGERLSLTMIDYSNPISSNILDSHLWEKCKNLLLVHYYRDKSIKDKKKYGIKYVTEFTPSDVDLEIIKEDYRIIAGKIQAGKAHELSEGDTMYLGACTKGETAEKSIVSQYYNPDVKAKKRAFCYKTGYMTYVLNSYVIPGATKSERIINDIVLLKNTSFSDYIIDSLNKHIGETDRELCKLYNIEYSNNKALWSTLAFRMLGIKSNKAEEFEKANIVVKAIRLEEDGKMIESMSFPAFKYKELINTEFEDSDLYNYFNSTKFLFVVFKKYGTDYKLEKAKLWNMPYNDLNEIVKDGYIKVQNIIKDGIKFSITNDNSGKIIIKNNFPKKSENEIIHVRPHASKRYYDIPSLGIKIENGSIANANQLPDGSWMPNHCFWLNNSYILKQLK